MIIKNAVLDIVCGVTSTLPDTGMPEVAFAGKSNVGKSSLINGLLNRKALARTSSQPGKTQTIKFRRVLFRSVGKDDRALSAYFQGSQGSVPSYRYPPQTICE